jgi:hypothetical protein
LDLLDAIEARPRRKSERSLDIIRRNSVEHDEARARRKIAESFRLAPGRNEEISTACIEQGLNRLARSKAISIGLHRSTRCDAGAVS